MQKWSSFLSRFAYKFVCTTIVCKRSSVKNIFHSLNGDLLESSVRLSLSGVGRVELISLIKSVDFRHFGVSFFFFFDYCTGFKPNRCLYFQKWATFSAQLVSTIRAELWKVVIKCKNKMFSNFQALFHNFSQFRTFLRV